MRCECAVPLPALPVPMSSCRFVTGGEGAIREHVTVAHTCTSHLIWPLSSTLTLKPWPMGARLCGQVWRGCSKGTEIDPLGHCPVPNSVMTLVTPQEAHFTIRQEWLKVAVVFIVTPPRHRQAAKKTRLCRSRESWLPITHPCTHPTHSREVQEGDQ